MKKIDTQIKKGFYKGYSSRGERERERFRLYELYNKLRSLHGFYPYVLGSSHMDLSPVERESLEMEVIQEREVTQAMIEEILERQSYVEFNTPREPSRSIPLLSWLYRSLRGKN